MELSRTENAVRNTLAAFLLQIVTMMARFVSQTIFIQLLGKQYAGVAGVFSDILQMLAASELGIGAAVLFSLYQPIKDNDYSKISSYMSLLKRVYHIVSIVIMGGGIILLPFLRYIVKDVPDIKEDIRVIFMLFVIKTALSYLFHYRAVLFEAYQYKRIQSLINCISSIVIICIQVVILYLTRQYYTFLFLEIAGVLLSNFVLAVKYDRKYSFIKKEKAKLSGEEMGQVWKNVGNLSLYRVATISLNATDSIIISSMLGTAIVGLLSGYRMLTNYVFSFSGQFLHSSLPGIGNATVSETTEHNYLIYKRLSFVLFVITCITSTCLFVSLSPFVKWWLGEDFVVPTGVVAVLVMNYFTSMMMIVNTSFRNVYGLFNRKPMAPVCMAVTNIVLSIFLGKLFGLIGIFAATSISRMATLLWVDPWLLYKNVYNISMKEYWIEFVKKVILVITSCALTYLCTDCIWGFRANFVLRLAIALLISALIIRITYSKSEEYGYFIKKAKKLVRERLR